MRIEGFFCKGMYFINFFGGGYPWGISGVPQCTPRQKNKWKNKKKKIGRGYPRGTQAAKNPCMFLSVLVLLSPSVKRFGVYGMRDLKKNAFEVPTANIQQPQPQAQNWDIPMLTPPLSTVAWSKTVRFSYLNFFIVTLQANIKSMFFKQRCPWNPEASVSRWHKQTIRTTGGHGNSMTDLAQRAQSVKKKKLLQLQF